MRETSKRMLVCCGLAMQSLSAGCGDTHGIDPRLDARAEDTGTNEDAALDAAVDARPSRPDANADANAPLVPTTVTYEVDGSPMQDAWIIFGDVDGEIVEVARTDAEGHASSLLFEEGMVTAVAEGWEPPRFEVRTDIRRGDALRFGQSLHDIGTFVRANVVANDAFPGAARYRVAGVESELGVPVAINEFYPAGTVGVLAEAIDASGEVIAVSWFEGAISEGATVTFPPWELGTAIPVTTPDATDVVLQVAVAGTYRRVCFAVRDVLHVPTALFGRPARIFASTNETGGSRLWTRRTTLTAEPVVVPVAPSSLCGIAYATSAGPRPTFQIPMLSGDQTGFLVVANTRASGRLLGHRSNWWFSLNPALRQVVRVPAIPEAFTAYQATALAEMTVYATGRDAPDVASFEQARTTLGPVDATYGNSVRVAPNGEEVSCQRTASFVTLDRDQDGLPDASDPCPTDPDDNC